MTRSLVISVRLLDGRYHGAGEWPPSPARLFQALVAGAGLSGPLKDSDRHALSWLETLDHPMIAAPRKRDGHLVTLYVPNNDLDSVGGDLGRIAEIRGSQKVFKPRLLDGEGLPFRYMWEFEEGELSSRYVPGILSLAERLYQFGRGVDFAFAWGEVSERAAVEEDLFAYPGTVHRPSSSNQGFVLRCPTAGSLATLENRYREFGQRFGSPANTAGARATFTRSTMPRFRPAAYDSPSRRYVFELRQPSNDSPFVVWPMTGIARLVELARDGAVARLCAALPSAAREVERGLIGRVAGEECPPQERVRIVPLPSIGHAHADRGVRRVLVEVPAASALLSDDVQWAFSGLEIAERDALKTSEVVLSMADDQDGGMLRHFGVGDRPGHRHWRTVTPAALPAAAERRRIDPNNRIDDAKGGRERKEECVKAGGAVIQALRHAGVAARVDEIRVQREPFESNGERAESFADGTRFSKHRLWHVEIKFSDSVAGPLIIGDGRFLGLGLLAPMVSAKDTPLDVLK